MSGKILEKMVQIISKNLPEKQAIQEARWIYQELPESEWINACDERSNLIPLQYILGNQPFGKLDLKCKPGVLIPRLDTEEWVIEASKYLKNVQIDNLIDYCTGSGCIGLGLGSELGMVKQIDCIDFKEEAVDLSIENYNHNKDLINVPMSFHQGDLFKSYLPKSIINGKGKSSFLVSNPPYIPENDLIVPEVEESVLKYEPREALVGNLEFYEALSENLINKNQSIEGFIFELGYESQADIVRKCIPKTIWEVGIRFGSNENIRNVIGYKHDSRFSVLRNMMDKVL